MDHRLDHHQVFGGHHSYPQALELLEGGPLQHLLVQVDVAGRAEDHVDQHALLDPFEQPEGVRPLDREPLLGQRLEDGVGVVRPHEQVDVVSPSRSPVQGGGDPADEGIGDPFALDGADGFAGHA